MDVLSIILLLRNIWTKLRLIMFLFIKELLFLHKCFVCDFGLLNIRVIFSNPTRQVLLKCQSGTLAFHFWHFGKLFYPHNQRAYSDFLIRGLYRAEGLRKTIPKTLWWNEYLFANRYSLLEPVRCGNTKSFHGTHRY